MRTFSLMPVVRNSLLAVALAWLGGLSVWAQTPAREKLQADATVAAELMRSGQYEKLLDTMYPPVVEMAGGRVKMQAILQDTLLQMDAAGLKLDAVEIGKASVPVSGGGKMFAVVPETIRMTTPKTRMEQSSYLLGISSDEGKSWQFIDGSGVEKPMLKKLFPEFPAALKLPEKQKPKVLGQ